MVSIVYTVNVLKHQITSLVECWGGKISSDALSQTNLILVPDYKSLSQVTRDLICCLKTQCDASSWSIVKGNEKELEDFIVRKRKVISHGEDVSVESSLKLPLVQTKWLEDSICRRYLQCIEKYCWGILCFSKAA